MRRTRERDDFKLQGAVEGMATNGAWPAAVLYPARTIFLYHCYYVYDFPSRSSKLSSRSLRVPVGNKELLHTTQLQTALYTASGERRQLGIVPSCLRIQVILSSVWFEGNEISVACACMRIGRACNGPVTVTTL